MSEREGGEEGPILGTPGPQGPADTDRIIDERVDAASTATGSGEDQPAAGGDTSPLPSRIGQAGAPALRETQRGASADPDLRPMRRDSRVGRLPRHPQWMLNQLPVGMLESDFFVRFVSIFQEVGGRLLEDADVIDHLAEVSVTPPAMLPYLASWIGVQSVDASLSEDLQRILVASSAKALAWRGTRRGITSYLKMLSGSEARVEDSGGVWPQGRAPTGPAWMRMEVEHTGHLSDEEFAGLIRDEVPANVRAELWVGNRQIWSNVQEQT